MEPVVHKDCDSLLEFMTVGSRFGVFNYFLDSVYIWVECDSSYVVGLFNSSSSSILWPYRNRRRRVQAWAKRLNIKVSHIFREDNSVVDRLASYGVTMDHISRWTKIPNFISPLVRRDMVHLPYYHF